MVDVVGALTEQPDARGASNYWAKLKQRLLAEKKHSRGGQELFTDKLSGGYIRI